MKLVNNQGVFYIVLSSLLWSITCQDSQANNTRVIKNSNQGLQISQSSPRVEIQNALNELHQIRVSGGISMDRMNTKQHGNKSILYTGPGDGSYGNELSIMYQDIGRGYRFKVLGDNSYRIVERVIGLEIRRCSHQCPVYYSY